jgi:putative lipoprotein (rSAM/lipoprotein system)
MGRTYYKFLASVIGIIGLVVGFSARVIAQYGAPQTYYRIKGQITSRECYKPISNLKVVVQSKEDNIIDTIRTNSAGIFNARVREFDYSGRDDYKTFVITVYDTDGKENGGSFDFEKQTVTVKPYTVKEVVIQLPHLDTPPCMEKEVLPPVAVEPAPVIVPTTKDTTKTPLPVLKPQPITSAIKDDEFTLYPNPARNQFTVEFNSTTNTPISLSISNEVGSVVFIQNFIPIIGSQKVTVNSLILAPGTYLLSLIQGAKIVTKKLVII